MATLPRPPINPNQPIPNNPFYVPETNYLMGEYSPFIIGSGLSLDNTSGVLSATGTPFAVIAGTGISIVTVGSNNTISVADSGVTSGSYTLADITVDATGRIVSASSGSITGSSPIVVTPGLSTNISVDAATLFAAGVVQLNDTTSSTSVTEALTANQGKLLQDQINALAVSSNLTFAGTIDGSTGLLQTVTTAAAAVGFIVGDPLPVAGATNEDYFVIVSVSGTMTPTGGSPTATNQGDWFLSNGTIWQFLDVGFNETYASTTAPGLIQLGTDAEVQAGTDGTKAVVPSSLQSKISDSVSTTSSTTIASSTAVKTAYDLADVAVPDSSFLASGDLLVGTGPGTYSALAAGPADYILASDGSGSLTWVQQSEGDVTGVTGTAPITVDNTDPQNPIVGVDAASTTASGVVQLYDNVDSTSTTLAATANAVKAAYDAAIASVQTVSGTAPVQVDNTDPQNLIVSVDAASTTAAGVVQLNDTLSSTSTTEALTAAQGKVLQDELNALAITSNLTFAGTLDTATGNLVTVSVAGAAQGFTIGSPLPSPAAGNTDYFVIVTVAAAAYTPPGGSPTLTHVGDWFLSDGTVWEFLDVGFDAPYASTTIPGIVELSTNAETQTGTDETLAVTPASLQSKVSDSVSTTSSTTIASSTAVKTAYDLANAAIPDSTILAKGDLIAGTAAGTYSALSVGTNGQILYANSTCSTGVCWGDQPIVPSATPLIEGIVYGCTTSTSCNLSLGQCALGNATGLHNTAIGFRAGCAITTGQWNIVVGSCACMSCSLTESVYIGTFGSGTMGCQNVGIGISAGGSACASNQSVFIGGRFTGPSASTTFPVNSSIHIGVNVGLWSAGTCNVGIGRCSLGASGTLPVQNSNNNVAIGANSMQRVATGSSNVALGISSGTNIGAGSCNVLLGALAGNALCAGECNVFIGPGVGATFPLFSDSCTLRIGFSNACTWICGLSTKAIKPGAGIIDCADSCGTAGQVLMSNGANAICWGDAAGGVQGVTGTSPITVDNTDPLNPVIGVDSASTPALGVVQLNDSVTSTSTSEAATANAVKCAYDLANASLPKAGGTMTGDIVFSGVGRGIEFDDTSFVEAISDSTITTCSTIAASATAVKLTMDVADAAIPCSSFTAKGDLLVATGVGGVHTALPVGANDSLLVADSACGTGMKWSTLPPATPISSGTLFGCIGFDQIATTAIGRCALLNYGCNPGGMSGVTAIGFCALAQACCLTDTVAIGNLAGRTGNGSAVIGINGVFIGSGAAECGIVASNNNTAIGYRAMRCAIANGGNSNIAIGTQTLGLTTCIGQNNIAIGAQAGQCISGSTNVVIGSGAAGLTLTTGSNNIVLGSSASTSSATVSNTITLGNSSITTIRAQVTTITSLSDERDKTDIVALPVGLDFINSLNPVKFTWKMREANEVKDGTSEAGFIAQDLQTAQNAADASYLDLVYDDNPEKLEASPGKLIPVLVKAIQELSAEVEKLKAQINA